MQIVSLIRLNTISHSNIQLESHPSDPLLLMILYVTIKHAANRTEKELMGLTK